MVEITGAEASVSLIPRTELMDPDNSLSPAEAAAKLAAPDATVVTVDKSHGFVAGTLWARIVLDVAPEAAGRRYLTLELPTFDRLQVFSVAAGNAVTPPELLFTLGDRVPPATDLLSRFHLAPLDLPAGRTVLLVGGRTNSTMTMTLRLWKLVDLLDEERHFYALQMFYYGVVVVLFLGALGLFAFTRQAIYVVYMISLLAHCGIWLVANGIGPGYLWPALAARYSIEVQTMLGLSAASLYAFVAMFLSTLGVPRAVPVSLWVMTVICGYLTVQTLIVPESYMLVSNWFISQVALSFSVLTVIPMIVAVRGRDAAVLPLFLVWLALNVAVAVAVARNAGFLPSNTFVLNVPQLGSVIEMIILAYMLVARLGRVQREALRAAQAHEAELEQRVADRTAELDLAVAGERRARRLQQQFVAMVSHEFRTPLAVVDAAAQNFVSGDRGDRDRLEKIFGAVRRLRQMIDTCLIDDRVEGGVIHLQTEAVDLSGVIEDAVEILQAAYRRHAFRLDLPDDPVVVMADPRLITVAVTNVLENAAKYSPPDSTVEVTLAASPAGVEVAVADKGVGIPEADRDRIFDRFYRGDNAGRTSGAGLGLFLVRSILETHRGIVRCEAGADGGSRFVICLPATDATEGGPS